MGSTSNDTNRSGLLTARAKIPYTEAPPRPRPVTTPATPLRLVEPGDHDAPRVSAAHAALRDAAAAMAIARRENDTALTARAAAVRALNDATAEFDRQYGALVRLILLTDPDGIGARLPRFRRGGSSVAPAAGQAAAPPPAPSPEPEADPADAPTPEDDWTSDS